MFVASSSIACRDWDAVFGDALSTSGQQRRRSGPTTTQDEDDEDGSIVVPTLNGLVRGRDRSIDISQHDEERQHHHREGQSQQYPWGDQELRAMHRISSRGSHSAATVPSGNPLLPHRSFTGLNRSITLPAGDTTSNNLHQREPLNGPLADDADDSKSLSMLVPQQPTLGDEVELVDDVDPRGAQVEPMDYVVKPRSGTGATVEHDQTVAVEKRRMATQKPLLQFTKNDGSFQQPPAESVQQDPLVEHVFSNMEMEQNEVQQRFAQHPFTLFYHSKDVELQFMAFYSGGRKLLVLCTCVFVSTAILCTFFLSLPKSQQRINTSFWGWLALSVGFFFATIFELICRHRFKNEASKVLEAEKIKLELEDQATRQDYDGISAYDVADGFNTSTHSRWNDGTPNDDDFSCQRQESHARNRVIARLSHSKHSALASAITWLEIAAMFAFTVNGVTLGVIAAHRAGPEANCWWLHVYDGRDHHEKCFFHIAASAFMLFLFFVFACGRPRFFPHLFPLAASVIIALWVPSVDSLTTVARVITVLGTAAFCTLLVRHSEVTQRLVFEAALTLTEHTQELELKQLGLEKFIEGIIPVHLRQRIIATNGMTTLSADVSPTTTVMAVNVANTTHLARTMLPRQAASYMALFGARCAGYPIPPHVPPATASRLHHIRSVGDSAIIVSGLFDAVVDPLVFLDFAQYLKEASKFLAIKCGIADGMLVGLPIGKVAIRYDVFGPAHQTALQLSMSADPGTFHVATTVLSRMQSTDMLQMKESGSPALEPADGNYGGASDQQGVLVEMVCAEPRYDTVSPPNNHNSNHEDAEQQGTMLWASLYSEQLLTHQGGASTNSAESESSSMGTASIQVRRAHVACDRVALLHGSSTMASLMRTLSQALDFHKHLRPTTSVIPDLRRVATMCGFANDYTDPSTVVVETEFRQRLNAVQFAVCCLFYVGLTMLIVVITMFEKTFLGADRAARTFAVTLLVASSLFYGVASLSILLRSPQDRRVSTPHAVVAAVASILVLVGTHLTRPSIMGDNPMFLSFTIAPALIFASTTRVAVTIGLQLLCIGVHVVCLIGYNPIIHGGETIFFIPSATIIGIATLLFRRQIERRMFLVLCESHQALAQVEEQAQIRSALVEGTVPKQLLPYMQQSSPNPQDLFSVSASRQNVALQTWGSDTCVVMSISLWNTLPHSAGQLFGTANQQQHATQEMGHFVSQRMEAIETALSSCRHQTLGIVNVFGGTALVCGPIVHPSCPVTKEERQALELQAMADCMDVVRSLLAMPEISNSVTVGIAANEAISVLRSTDFPAFDVFGPAINNARALMREAPYPMIVATEHLTKYFEAGEVQLPAELDLKPAESWRIRGVGILRLRRIALV